MFTAILSFPQCQVTECFLPLMTIWLWDLTEAAQNAQTWPQESGSCVGGKETTCVMHGCVQDVMALDISVQWVSLRWRLSVCCKV